MRFIITIFTLFMAVADINSQEVMKANVDFNVWPKGELNTAYVKKEIGNTLETRGLTYSYTFLTKPKNAHLECKGTKLFPNNQRVRLLFALLYINAA